MLLTHLPVLVLLGAFVAPSDNTYVTNMSSTPDMTDMDSSTPFSSWTGTSESMTPTETATAAMPAENTGLTSSVQVTELWNSTHPVSTGSHTESSAVGVVTSTETDHPVTASDTTKMTAAPSPGHTLATTAPTTHYTDSASPTHMSTEAMTHMSDEPITHTSGEPMTHTSGEPMTHTSGEPMTHTSGEAMTHTSGEAMTHTSGEAMTHTSGEAMTHTSGKPVTYTSGQPVTHTSGEAMTHTSGKPVTYTSGEPVPHTSGHSVTHTSGEAMTHTSGEPVTYTSGEPVTHTSGEPLTHTSGEPVTHTSGEPVTHTSGEPMTQTSSEPITDITDSTTVVTHFTSVPPTTGDYPTLMTDVTQSINSTPTTATHTATSPPSMATAGSPPSTPTSSSPPPSISPGSSTVPHTGNTLSPSSASATGATTGVTIGWTTPSVDGTTAPPGSTPSLDTTITSLEPTEISTASELPFTTLSPVSVAICPLVPCPPQSVCLNSTCQCVSGFFLLDGQCQSAQVFPGQLHLTRLMFENEMYDRSSSVFQRTSAEISAALRDALEGQLGYIRSEVVQLQPGSVIASVNNIFRNTNITQVAVDQSIKTAIASSVGLLANTTYAGTDLCESVVSPCDTSTTTCTSANGQASCSCKKGYVSDLYSTISCKACPSGQQAVENACQQCSFGYTGFNCDDPYLLAVVVVSCVLGGILLILVLALLACCCWRLCMKSKRDYSNSPYSSSDQSWPTSVTPIPRATTHWNSAPSFELMEGGNTNTPVNKKPTSNGLSGSYDLESEGLKTFKGKNTSRYSYLVQGHENPYFLPGDG